MKSIFVTRYGKLLSTEQEGNYGKDGFHNAPEKFGFYCFNRKYRELFLVGEKMYNRDIYHGEITGGYIWTHLEPKRNQIIQSHNGWYQIRAEDYYSVHRNNYITNVRYYDREFECNLKYARDHLEIFCTNETIISNIRRGHNKHKYRGALRSTEIDCQNYDKEWTRYQFNKENEFMWSKKYE